MAKKAVDDGRTLFDEVVEDLLEERPRVDLHIGAEWREVPQALFLSWSPARQFAYCAERDLRASIEFATSPEEERWFYERAVAYTQMKDLCLATNLS